MSYSNLMKSSLTVLGLASIVGIASAAPQNVPLPNSVLPVVGKSLPAFSAKVTSAKIEVAISLKPQDPLGLQAFADAVSDPSSAMYGKYISPEEVGNRFGASVKDVAAAKDFLTKGGLTIIHVGKNNLTISATGTKAQVEALFGTTIANFQITDETGNVTYRANTTPLKVPATLVNKIQSINGIESYTRPKPRTTAMTPPLARTLYGLQPLFTAGFKGQGRKVAVSNWDGFDLNNGNLYINQYGLPVPAGGAMSNVSVVPVGTGSQNNGASGEGDLDFQMELGASPLATIIIYDGTGNNLTTVLSTEASENRADVISESYGWNIDAATAGACHNTHLAMTTQGITYCAASGDSGTDLEPFDYPDYDPEVLMVGGTDATTDGAGNRISEPNWGPGGNQGGGGGGWCAGTPGSDGSPFNARPTWQVGNGVPSASIVNKRLVPDVSEHATDWDIFVGGTLGGIGGTSAASPAFAGGLTVVEQKLFAVTNKARLGRVANKIYAQNGKNTVWFDVTTGQGIGPLPSTGGGSLNGTPANPTVGWDFATGWGAANFNGLYNSLVTAVTLTPFYAQGVTPVAGTYVSGTKVSLNEVDNNQYTMRSAFVNGLGQVAGFNSVYTNPFLKPIVLQFNLAVTGPNGASAIVSFQNTRTGAYDQFTSAGLNGSMVTKTVVMSASDIASYVHSDGTISLIVRGVLPSRAGQSSSSFTFSCDKASFSGASGS